MEISQELKEILKTFYTLTNILVVLFDDDWHELFAYPSSSERVTFCSIMRKNPEFISKCRSCDEYAFRIAASSPGIHIYRCHAGLTEAVAAVRNNGRIVGYLMLGQINEEQNSEKVKSDLLKIAEKYGVSSIDDAVFGSIGRKSEEQIHAAASILSVCADYVSIKQMLRDGNGQPEVIAKIIEYIDGHMPAQISISDICREFYLSRTSLYNLSKRYFPDGLSSYIRRRRLEHAKGLLESSKMSLSDISETCGFTDYNYFTHCMKKEFGLSAKEIRDRQNTR